MKKQTILWTAIPKGHGTNGRLRVSVLVSFRLESDATSLTLDQFPDLLSDQRDWPAVIRNARFRVRLGQVTLPAERVVDHPDDPPEPDSDLWRALFDATTFVRPYEFDDYSNRLILSYPVIQVHEELQSFYGQLMEEYASDLPRPSDLMSLIDPTFVEMVSPEELLQELKAIYPNGGSIPWGDLPALSTPFPHFALLRLFHTPPAQSFLMRDPDPTKPTEEMAIWKTHTRVDLPDKKDFKDRLDFHQRVAALQQYPRLLRRLGLVFDLAVAPSGPGVNLPTPFKLSVLPRWRSLPAGQSGVETVNTSLYTWANVSAETFQAHPKNKDADISQGLLRLDDPGYDLVQVDVDGSAIKLMNTMGNANQQTKANKENEEEMGAPTLRTGGLAVIRTEKGKWLADKIQNNGALNDNLEGNPPKDVELFAEDLVRGYFLDVWDDATRQWRSLCQRSGSYHFVGTGQTIKLNDEGVIQTGVTQSPDYPDNPDADQLYLHEATFDWRGWSLVAPRPGKTIDPEDKPESIQNTAPPGLGLEVNFKARQGTLSRLRFGRGYKLRARVVDLAGNSLPPTTADIGDGSITTESAPYLRFEAVPAPALALVEDGGLKKPYEGESMDRLAIRSFNSGPDKDGDPTSQTTQRFVLPPRSTQIGAETHGMFDLPSGQLDKQKYSLITGFDGSLSEQDVGGTKYAYGQVPLKMPYLPDPFAHDIVVQVLDHKKQPLPGFEQEPIPLFDSTAVWPEAMPFRIDLQEGSNSVKFDPVSRLLEVRLEKAEVIYLRFSARLTRIELEQMGLWQWRLQRGSPTNTEIEDALNGRNWLLTPWRDVALVHATQQPLGIPEMIDLIAERSLDRTYVRPAFWTPLSRKSTAKVDLLAQWQEPVDDPAQKQPDKVGRADHAFEYKVPLEAPYDRLDFIELGPRHELGDTRYQRITYTLEATTRFREYMPAAADPPLEAADLKRSSEPKTIYVPNAARPQAPRVLYVLPTFEWQRTELDGGAVQSLRKGGGLRVYLERPWYSSGYGEMLAVVLRGSFDSSALDKLKPYITQWGRDPLWRAPAVAGIAPHPTHFKRARFSPQDLDPTLMKELQPTLPIEEYQVMDEPFPVENLPLAELPGAYFDIAPHDVGYDLDRQLWYCDIEIDPGPAYYPFIRLALARYHPNSLFTAHLSPVVLADFAQLSPDRFASVSPVPGNAKARRITVSGYAHAGSPLEAEPESHLTFPSSDNLIEIAVEKMQPDVNTDLGWQEIDAAITEEKPYLRPDLPILWQGVVELPEIPAGDDQYRIVIREYEQFAVDILKTAAGHSFEIGKRLAYVEAIEIS